MLASSPASIRWIVLTETFAFSANCSWDKFLLSLSCLILLLTILKISSQSKSTFIITFPGKYEHDISMTTRRQVGDIKTNLLFVFNHGLPSRKYFWINSLFESANSSNFQCSLVVLLTCSISKWFILFSLTINATISAFLSTFHYSNQHDLPNWTFAYSTIEIGHWTLDPPAPNRKSVLIPIFKIRICTLSISYRCRHTVVYRLFFCTFKDSNTLHMSRQPFCLA